MMLYFLPFKAEIECGFYRTATQGLSYFDISNQLVSISFEFPALYWYTLLWMLIYEHADLELHAASSKVITAGFLFECTYAISYMHDSYLLKYLPEAKKITHKKRLMDYIGHPDQVFTLEQGKDLVLDVLEKEPKNNDALFELQRILSIEQGLYAGSSPYRTDIIEGEALALVSTNKKMTHLIQHGQLFESFALLEQSDIKNIWLMLYDATIETHYKSYAPCVAIYTFACFMVLREETAQDQVNLAQLLLDGFSSLEGVHSSALFHVRRALELDPHHATALRMVKQLEDKIDCLAA